MIPSQKLGTERPQSATKDAAKSTGPLRRTAETMPAGIAISSDITMAADASCRVGPNASPSIASTGLPVWIDRPRSPWRTLPTQIRYCTGSDRSRP